MTKHRWGGMLVDIHKSIGCGCCGRCVPEVISPDGGKEGFPAATDESGKYFFVPKMCNHCADSPCTQVCPVGATFIAPDGVVLVDPTYCLGCAYCVQACPYGDRKS